MLGNKWQSVTGRLKEISVGLAGVWGLSPSNEVMYRDGTWHLPGEAEGSGWTKVDGVMQTIWSCDGGLWAVSQDGGLWYRHNLSQATPMGTNWYRMEVSQSHLTLEPPLHAPRVVDPQPDQTAPTNRHPPQQRGHPGPWHRRRKWPHGRSLRV